MDLISLVVILVIVGVLMWLVGQAPFIDARFKKIIYYIVLAVVVIWLLQLLLGPIPNIQIGR